MPLFDRKHPYRLAPEEYRVPGRITFITVGTRSWAMLASPAGVAALVQAMARIGDADCVDVLAYCVMPDHLHVVAVVADYGGDLAAWIRYVKGSVAKRLGATGVWKRSYWDREARSDEELSAMVQYTLDNPVRAGLCEAWHAWDYSWSWWHDGGRGPDPRRGEAGGR